MTLRPALLTAAALAAALGICFALYRWGAGGNSDLTALSRAVQHGEELESHIEAGRRRDGAKRALAAEVVAGRMTLQEAAGHFRHLDETDPGFPLGIARPPADERARYDRVLDCGWEVLAHEGRFAEAARWYAEVFAAHPQLLVGSPTGHRYYAAWAAVLAGYGQGRDASDLDEEGRTRFRRQALGWLRAELEAQRRLLEREPAPNRGFIAGGLQRWLRELYFAGVRGPDSLGRLPAAERQAWQKLWTDVADTLARAVDRLPHYTLAEGKTVCTTRQRGGYGKLKP
jgi:hypothetical protein